MCGPPFPRLHPHEPRWYDTVGSIGMFALGALLMVAFVALIVFALLSL